MMWCWRCKTDVPILDDDEYRQVTAVRGTGTHRSIQEKFMGPVLAEYERITGFHETNANAIFHHRASDYGPPWLVVREAFANPESQTLRPLHEVGESKVSAVGVYHSAGPALSQLGEKYIALRAHP
jgi:hypothetical protein